MTIFTALEEGEKVEENAIRSEILRQLSQEPTMVLQIALISAKGLVKYGVELQEKWTTAVQHNEALLQAEKAGYQRAMDMLSKRCEFCEYRNIILRQQEQAGEQE